MILPDFIVVFSILWGFPWETLAYQTKLSALGYFNLRVKAFCIVRQMWYWPKIKLVHGPPFKIQGIKKVWCQLYYIRSKDIAVSIGNIETKVVCKVTENAKKCIGLQFRRLCFNIGFWRVLTVIMLFRCCLYLSRRWFSFLERLNWYLLNHRRTDNFIIARELLLIVNLSDILLVISSRESWD